MMPKLVLIMWILVRESYSYDIHRGACTRYAMFKVTDRNTTVNEGILFKIRAKSLSFCVKYCVETSDCKSIDYKPPRKRLKFNNCHILNNTRLSGSTVNVTGWNHYEPVPQSVTPGCMVLGSSAPCSPGYHCSPLCNRTERFQCLDIDECESNPCQNGATCLNMVNKYECRCVPGYGGTNCQTEIDECASGPCLNGGVCTDHLNRFTCSCAPGWVGIRCRYSYNDCIGHGCVHGTCSDHHQYYTCNCNTWWGGPMCDKFLGGRR